MRVVIAILVALSLAAAFAAGRNSRSTPDSDLASLSSFGKALDEWDLVDRSIRFNGFLQSLSAENLAPALEMLEAEQDWLAKEEVQNFLFAWSGFDPRGALDWALAQNQYFRKTAVPAAIYGWGFHDPIAAQAALESLEADLVEEATPQLIAGWAHSGELDAVASYLAAQPGGRPRKQNLGALTTALSRAGADALIRWVEAIPPDTEEGFRTVAYQQAAETLASVDPVRAASWIEGHLDDDFSGPALSTIGVRWTEQDPSSALGWLSSLPSGDRRDRAVQKALARWMQWDPKQTEAWMIASTPAEGLDEPVRTLVRKYSIIEPSRAIGWAQRIHDAGTRELVILGVGRAWFRRDPDAIRAWLSESDLSESTQQAILHPPAPTDLEGDESAHQGAADHRAA